MSDIHVLFVTTDRDRCVRSATQLEQADDGFEVAGATCVSGVKRALRATRIDCVVFGENPLSVDGSQLLDVVDAVEAGTGPNTGAVPVILFTDRTYGPATARETDGIAGYVRAAGPGAYDHLADRIRWTVGEDATDVQYETLVESMDDGVLVLDDECRIRYANAAMEEVFGVDPDRYLDRPVRTLDDDGLLSTEDARRVCVAVESVLAGDAEDRAVEITVDPEAGQLRVVELHVGALPGHSPGGALATVRTVTEYKRTESALRDTRTKIERLHAVTGEMGACRTERELFELTVEATDRLFDVDVCGVDVVAGDEFVPMVTNGTDYGPSAVTGIAGRAYQVGESILVDDASEGADSSPIDGARSVLAVPIDTRGVLRVVSHHPDQFDERDRDLAELLVAHVGESLTRIRVGITLRERQRDLVAERERLVALFENVPSPVVSYEFENGEPVIRDANQSFATTFGIDIDAVVGDPIRSHVEPPQDAPDDDGGIDETLRGEEGITTAVRRETVDGPRDFLLHAGPLSDRDGEGYVIYTDISDQKDHERALEDHNRRLDEFADVAATDLRARLNDARGYLELAEETGDNQHFTHVRRAHERMSRLIDDLRYLAQPETTVDDSEHVSIEDAATRAWAGVETGSLNLDVEDVTIEADPARLEELIGQLLRNAVDHAAPDVDLLDSDMQEDTDLTVSVGPLATAEGFYVEDTGTGIPHRYRDRVFDDGFSTRRDSPGLGLSVVQRIAAAHDWSIRVTESEAGGARFEFVPAATHPEVAPESE